MSNNNSNINNSSSSDDGSAPNSSLNPSLLSLAGFMGANMRGANMSGMPGLNHMRGNMSVVNQAGTSMSMNSVSVNNASNVGGGGGGGGGGGWMSGGGGGGGGGSGSVHIGSENSGVNNNNAMVSPANMMWSDMADSLMERGRSKNWTYEETMELITTYTSDEWQNKFSSEKKNHRAIWAEMAEVLKKREGVTGDEARQRLNNLKALYNRIRRQLIAGEIASPQWEYWDSLHHFLTRPSQYHGFGFPRTSPPIRGNHTPQMHPPHTPTGPSYSPMHHMQLPRPMHHTRMGGMMPPHMTMPQRSHDMQSSMPFNCPPFKVSPVHHSPFNI